MSGGTYVQEIPVRITGFTATQPATVAPYIPTTISGYTFGTKSLVSDIPYDRKDFPVDDQGFPIVPQVGVDSWFQAGAGWFEQTLEHRGRRITDFTKSVFTGNTPTVKTKLNAFTYGEPYLERFRRFPSMMDGFDIARTVDNKKSWVEEQDTFQTRYYSLRDRGTKYFTDDERLVMNVKNVELFMNVGQGLEWDVWNYSRKYGCPFGLTALVSPPYPGLGGIDDTEVKINASTMSFFEFASQFYKILINVKNRLTIDDAKGGGYPTLQNVYDDYINNYLVTCGVKSSQYTYQKMIDYCEKIGDYWIRLMEQFIPATTIWQGGVRFENSIFHRYKFPYKHEPLCDDIPCLGSWVECARPPLYDTLANHCYICEDTLSASTGYTNWTANIQINNQSYTSGVYYTSTGCTDPPQTSYWFSAMTEMLDGIQTNTADPNSGLTYYIIDTTTDNTIDLDGDGTPDIYLNNPDSILIQGPCSEAGEDLWNFNNGSDPHTYNSWQNLLEQDWLSTGSTTAYTAIYNFTLNTGNTPTYTLVSGHDLIAGGSSLFPPPSVIDGGGISTCWNCPGTGMTEGTVHYCVDWGFTGCTGDTSAYSATTSWSGITGNTFIQSGTSWSCGEGEDSNRPDLLSGQYGSMWGYDTTLFVSGITISYNQNNVSFSGAMTATSIVYSGECCETNHAGCGGWEEPLTGNTVCPCDTVSGTYPVQAPPAPAPTNISSTPTALEFVDWWQEGYWNNIYDQGYNVLINVDFGSPGPIPGCYQLNTGQGALGLSDAQMILSYYWHRLPCSASTTNYTVPFDGGNNLWKAEDCEDTTTIPVNPPPTGTTTATTYPEIFKDGIFNIGGQACYQVFYPCPEWQDPCACPPASFTWTDSLPNGMNPRVMSHDFIMPGECVSCWTGDTSISFVNTSTIYPFIFWGQATPYSYLGQFGLTMSPGSGGCAASCFGQYVIHDPVGGGGFCDSLAVAQAIANCINTCTKYNIEVCDPQIAQNLKMGPNDGASSKITQTTPRGRFNPCDPFEPPVDERCECDDSVGSSQPDNTAHLSIIFDRVDPQLVPAEILNMPDFGPNANTIGGTTSRPGGYYHINGGIGEAAFARISVCCLGQFFEMSSAAYYANGSFDEIARITTKLKSDNVSYVDLWLLGPHPAGSSSDLFSWDFDWTNPMKKLNQLWMVIPDGTIDQMQVMDMTPGSWAQWVTHDSGGVGNVTLTHGIPVRIGSIDSSSDLFQINSSYEGAYGIFGMSNHINQGNGSVYGMPWNNMSEPYWYTGYDSYGGWSWGTNNEIFHANTGNNTSAEGNAIGYMYGGLGTGGPYPSGSVLWATNNGVGGTVQPPSQGWGNPYGLNHGGYNLRTYHTWYTWFEAGCSALDDSTSVTYGNVLFYPFDSGAAMLTTQGEIDGVIPQSPCPTSTPGQLMARTLQTYLPQIFEYSEPLDIALSEGGIFEFDYSKFLDDKMPLYPDDAFEITNSEPYIVMNSKNHNPGLKNLKYNNPEVRTRFGSLEFQTFVKNGNTEYQVGWRKEIEDKNNAQFIKFPSIDQRNDFEKSLKEKQIAGIETYNLFTHSKEYPIKWESALQWAQRSIGNPWLSNCTIHTAPDGSFSGITIRPDSYYSIDEDRAAYYAPITDPSNEIFGTTWSSWPQFTADKSGFTHSYTGYTDYSLSGTQPTQMFDLYFSYSAFTGNTLVPLSDKAPLEGKMIGVDENDVRISPAILPESLECNGGPTQISTQEGGIIYTPTSDGKYRIQFKAILDVKYEDTSWCDYVNRFYKKEKLDYSYPSNDYEYKELINSAIILKGGKVLQMEDLDLDDDTIVDNLEGRITNRYTDVSPYWQSNPIFGYNTSGINDFYFRIYLTNNSGQSETVLTEYTVTTSELVRPWADDFLTYDLLETDKEINTMSCSGSTSQILHKSFDVNLDTGPIMLSGNTDVIRLKYDAYWSSNIKDTGTTKTCTFKVNLGRKEPTNSADATSPWIRVTKRPYGLPTINKEIIWKKDKEGKTDIITTPSGEQKDIRSTGQLYITTEEVRPNYGDTNGFISITPRNFNNQTFLDIPNNGYVGPMKLEQNRGKATNLWSYALSSEYKKVKPRITDYYINGEKSIQWEEMKIRWNLPYMDKSQGTDRSVFPSVDNSYVIKTTFRGKINKSSMFDHFIVLNSAENDFINRDNFTVDLQQRLEGYYNRTVGVVQPTQDCEKRVYLSSDDIIIDGKRANIKTTGYNLNTPNNTPIIGTRKKLR